MVFDPTCWGFLVTSHNSPCPLFPTSDTIDNAHYSVVRDRFPRCCNIYPRWKHSSLRTLLCEVNGLAVVNLVCVQVTTDPTGKRREWVSTQCICLCRRCPWWMLVANRRTDGCEASSRCAHASIMAANQRTGSLACAVCRAASQKPRHRRHFKVRRLENMGKAVDIAKQSHNGELGRPEPHGTTTRHIRMEQH